MEFGQSFAAFATGLAGGRANREAREERAEDRAMQSRYLDLLERNQSAGVGMNLGAAPGSSSGRATGGIVGDDLWGLLNSTEGGGNYDTLYGHSQRDGGRFAGVAPSTMTLDQIYEFTDPNGEYGQWVAGQNNGTVATPVGAGQIVGTTMRGAAREMGLPGNTVFSPEVQQNMIMHLADRRLRGQTTPEGRRAALRSEWHGFRNVDDASLDRAIAQVLNRVQTPPTRMGSTRPVY